MPKVIEFKTEDRGMGGAVLECRILSLVGSTPAPGQIVVPDETPDHDWSLPNQKDLELRGDG